MAKTTKKTTRARKPAAEKPAAEAKTKTPREELCVFAFRLTEAERDAIHKAAGPAKASKFARSLLVAAATKDEASAERLSSGEAWGGRKSRISIHSSVTPSIAETRSSAESSVITGRLAT